MKLKRWEVIADGLDMTEHGARCLATKQGLDPDELIDIPGTDPAPRDDVRDAFIGQVIAVSLSDQMGDLFDDHVIEKAARQFDRLTKRGGENNG